jgi:rhodanese-related sulfurtransferase
MNYWHNPDPCDQFIVVDLRTYPEIEACPAESDVVLNVPLPPMRPEEIAIMTEQLYDLTDAMAPDQCIKIFCAKGKRSAVAVAILKQGGCVNVINAGGIECK